jgi:acetyl esterase/lipase
VVEVAGKEEAQGHQRGNRALPRAAARAGAALVLTLLLAACGKGDETVPQNPERQVPQGDRTLESVERPRGKPRGVMLIFSGGAWLAPPPTEIETTRHYEERYVKLGWVAVNVGYRPGGEQSFADVTRAYDRAKREHPDVPICAVGESAGGHLALMLAIERELDCIEPVGAPVDLTGGLPRILEKTAESVFGKDELERWSPLLRSDELRGRVMIVHAQNDKAVPVSQARALKRKLPEAELVVLPPGELAWMHDSRIDREAYARYLKREREWLEALG